MMKAKYLILLSLLALSIQSASGEFMTAGVVAVGSAITAGFFAGFNVINCIFSECCDDKWISTNFTEPVVKHLKGHARENPSKALALSFHGLTGTGKNYVSRIVAEKMFRKGMKSKYVHLISATKEFPHSEMISFYKDKLRDIIERAVKECPRSLIVIDEMDKMPPGVIDTIKPYLDFYEELGGVDYRKSTFFFLSNTAGTDIAERTIKYWSEGIPRENIRLKEMEEVIRLPALNVKENGLVQRGFYSTESVIPDSKVQEIADELQYYPQDLNVFSSTGCKRILEKIDFVMEQI
ncbi:TOR1B-like protein [Mya arenaria]|uniref:TOR1B-like protein n=1 Tax=Mya arenaria TaxID=6604 RepID=A0ABY7DNA3_MYAAR|nr:TOR1B-like protein [Mya arenaria]